jgi:hypothetical protein
MNTTSPTDHEGQDPQDRRHTPEEPGVELVPADDQVTSKPSPELVAFEAFAKRVFQTTQALGKDLNRHAPTYVGGFGAAIIVTALVMQIDFGVRFFLSSAEFIAVIVAGLVMLCLSAALVAFRLRSFERTEVAYGEQAKEILVGETLVPGSTLRVRTEGRKGNEGEATTPPDPGAVKPASPS